MLFGKVCVVVKKDPLPSLNGEFTVFFIWFSPAAGPALDIFFSFELQRREDFCYSQCPQNQIKSLFTRRAWPDFKLSVETETGWYLKKVSGSLVPELVQDYSHPLILASRTNLSPPNRVETAVVRQVIIIIRHTENIIFLYSVKEDKNKYNPDFTSSVTCQSSWDRGDKRLVKSWNIKKKTSFQIFLMIYQVIVSWLGVKGSS